MNDFKKGREVFKVGTNFDYYVLENKFTENNITKITDIHGKTYDKNLHKWKFIPSGGFNEFEKILAKPDEPTVNVLYDRSLYGTDKPNMSLDKTDKFIYPCVYTITQKDAMKCYYSSLKHPKSEKKDMFVPKVIWSNGLGTYPIVDRTGKYGLTQFAYGIVDDVENLESIENALNNKRFIELMEFVKFQDHKYNYKVISLLKTDFWKMFQNEAAAQSPMHHQPIVMPPSKKNTSRKLQKQTEPALKEPALKEPALHPDKILNPFTNKWVINNPANQKKIGKLTLKKGGKKSKSFKQRHKKTKKNKKKQVGDLLLHMKPIRKEMHDRHAHHED